MDELSDMKEGLHKARSGLIRVLVRTENGAVSDIIISGDFILSPEHFIDTMEEALMGVPASREDVLKRLKAFFRDNSFQSPQTYPEDFTEAIMKALGVQEEKT